MNVRGKDVLDLASIIGAITLFGAWAFQQTLLNKANGALQAIHSAEAGFETYQSNNTLFNALNAEAAPRAASEIRRFQKINYEFALRHLETPLSPEERAQLPAAARPFDGNWNAEAAMSQTQQRIDAVQAALRHKKEEITAHSSWANQIFVALYAAGSLLILVVSACKVFFPLKE